MIRAPSFSAAIVASPIVSVKTSGLPRDR